MVMYQCEDSHLCRRDTGTSGVTCLAADFGTFCVNDIVLAYRENRLMAWTHV